MFSNDQESSIARPWRTRVALLLALTCVALQSRPLLAEETPTSLIEQDPLYAAAVQALADSLPAVAIEKLTRLLSDGKPAETDIGRIKTKLLEAYVRRQLAEEALALAEDRALVAFPESAFWRAQALSLSGRYADAEKLFAEIAALPESPLREEAAISRANVLVLLGDPDRAIDSLEPIFSSEAASLAHLRAAEILFAQNELKEARAHLANAKEASAEPSLRAKFLEARFLLAEHEWLEAERILAPLVNDPRGQESNLHYAGYLALADAYAGGNETNKAERVLKAFLEKYPGSPLLEHSFHRLDALGVFSRTPVDQDLVAWSESPQLELKAVSAFYVGVAHTQSGQFEEAISVLEEFVAEHPDHFLYVEALLRLVSLYLETDDPESAADNLERIREGTLLPEVLDHVAYLEARTSFASGDFAAAASQFSSLKVNESDPGAAGIASYNAALAALRLGDEKLFASQVEILGQPPLEKMHSDLLLQQGLYLAVNGDPEAGAKLLDFTKRFPNHPQLAAVHIALAELAFLAFPPKPVTARQHLDLALGLPRTPAQEQQIDYIRVWIAESAEEFSEAVALGRRFVDRWPESSRLPEMRMKLGEIYFHQNEYPNAVAQFELLVEEFPESPLAETALFFAGKAARLTMAPSSLDKAIEIWGRVVDMDGSLALTARQHQGLAKMDIGEEAEAVTVFNSVLENDPPPEGDLLFSVLCSKGQALFVMSGELNTALDEAIGAFDAVIGHESAGAFWRNQASVRKAKCLEKSNNPTRALEILSDVIQTGPSETPDGPSEFLWFYRAGFEAIRLLEMEDDFMGAISIADKLAKSGGNRDEEAAVLANRLRLQHFVWEEKES